MTFPEWMGPNIEPRHVEVMGWGTELAPTPIGVPPLRDDPPGEENRYAPQYKMGMFDSAMRPGEKIVARDVLEGGVDLWIGGDDAARRCRMLVDGRKASG